jgi:hypothetical protein
MLSLSFVPPENVIDQFKTVDNFVINNNLADDFDKLKNYFIENYIGSVDLNGKLCGVKNFGISFWSSYERVLKQIPLTNNGVEAWNKSIKQRTQASHPNIGSFIGALQNEEEITRFKLIKCRIGESEKKQKTKYIEKNIRVFDCVSCYSLFEDDEYLKTMAKVYKIKINKNN